jgi:hypothetical protein
MHRTTITNSIVIDTRVNLTFAFHRNDVQHIIYVNVYDRRCGNMVNIRERKAYYIRTICY